MTPTPPSATVSSTGRSPEPQYRVVRKRNRVPLSCYPCRTRKLKCDRSHPCSNCTKREGADTLNCSYATPVSRRKNQGQADPTPDDMQNRIDRLEGLVLSLMHGGANIDISSGGVSSSSGGVRTNSSPSAAESSPLVAKVDGPDDGMMQEDDDSDTDSGLAKSLGVLKVDPVKSKHVYLGEEHWHTILLDIAEVKNYFANHKKEVEKTYERVRLTKPPTAKDPPILLMGATPASEVELRAELPPKSTVLTLCARYFNSMDNAATMIIHQPTFYQQLRNHWQDPSKTPIMWLAVLYSVLCLAMMSYQKVGDEPSEWKGRTAELADEYRLRTVQCLIAGDYTKPGAYTVEAMILYSFAEYSSRWDAELGLWIIIAMTVRTALRMGYHRDAKWFPTLSPFQAEMRRRTWAFLRLSDVLFSNQVSLPSMISENDCDTELPRNIFDDDFGPDTQVLPPSKPLTEPTPISYMLFKVKLCLELGTILQVTGRVKNQAHYDEILRFDAKLRDIRAELPPHLKMLPLESSTESATLTVTRFSIDILYLKVVCVLHRKYIPRARNNPRYAHSRRAAIEASLEMLRHLVTLHRESQPGGRLESMQWYVTSVATKDFLLPAMLIALDLHFDNAQRSGTRGGSQGPPFWSPEMHQEMINSLDLTTEIWKGLADVSVEAFKASKVLEIMLTKIKSSNSPSASDSSPDVAMRNGVFGANDSPELRSEHSAAMGLGMLSNGAMPLTAAAFHLARTPVGSAYSGVDLTRPRQDSGMGASITTSTSTGSGTGVSSDFSGAVLGYDGGQSPLSMFGNMASGNMDYAANLDWDSFENYTQTAHWGAESFLFFSGNTDPSQQQAPLDNSLFPYGQDPTGTS